MVVLRIRLFGKFCASRDHEGSIGLDSRKLQELFGYLLLYRQRPHSRETLAGILWGETGGTQSRANLRKALWQLQSALGGGEQSDATVLLVNGDWIQINPQSTIWLDVDLLERAFGSVEGVPGAKLSAAEAGQARAAVELYTSDLLEGCYQEWCLFERERLQNIYLALLDKLIGYCEAHSDFEHGMTYGESVLRYDRCREATHRQLMRLLFLAGDRTAAIRQYQRCSLALADELSVRPSELTESLYQQICAGALDPDSSPLHSSSDTHLQQIAAQLRGLQATLDRVRCQLDDGLRAVEAMMREPR